jgi:phage gp29-like protein
MLQAIGIERFLVGVPTIAVEGLKTGSPDHVRALEMAKQIRSNELSGIVKDKNWDLEILSTSGGAGEKDMAKAAIEHHDRAIAMNVLAPFLDLGQTGQGSFALSVTQGSFFLMQLVQEAADLSEVVNDAIVELFKMNAMEREKYPKLKATGIEQTDLKVLADALNVLISAGVVDTDIRLKEYVRNVGKLPEYDYKEEAEVEKAEREAQLKQRLERAEKGEVGEPQEPAKKEPVKAEPEEKEKQDDIEKAVKKVKKEHPEMSETLIKALFFESDEDWDKTATAYIKKYSDGLE